MNIRLETKRLILRKPVKNDWKDILEGAGEYDIAKMTMMPHPYKKKDALDFIKRINKNWKQKVKNDYSFIIELKSKKKVIGGIGIHNINIFSGVGKTGSWINKKYWRNSYITEAKVVLNDFAFNKLKLRRLESLVISENKASNATQTKMGYKFEGIQRKAMMNKASGKIHDLIMYGLLREDWKKVRIKLIKANQ